MFGYSRVLLVLFFGWTGVLLQESVFEWSESLSPHLIGQLENEVLQHLNATHGMTNATLTIMQIKNETIESNNVTFCTLNLLAEDNDITVFCIVHFEIPDDEAKLDDVIIESWEIPEAGEKEQEQEEPEVEEEKAEERAGIFKSGNKPKSKSKPKPEQNKGQNGAKGPANNQKKKSGLQKFWSIITKPFSAAFRTTKPKASPPTNPPQTVYNPPTTPPPISTQVKQSPPAATSAPTRSPSLHRSPSNSIKPPANAPPQSSSKNMAQTPETSAPSRRSSHHRSSSTSSRPPASTPPPPSSPDVNKRLPARPPPASRSSSISSNPSHPLEPFPSPQVEPPTLTSSPSPIPTPLPSVSGPEQTMSSASKHQDPAVPTMGSSPQQAQRKSSTSAHSIHIPPLTLHKPYFQLNSEVPQPKAQPAAASALSSSTSNAPRNTMPQPAAEEHGRFARETSSITATMPRPQNLNFRGTYSLHGC